MQPENALKLKPWKGDNPKDTTLLDLLPMLQMVAMRGVKDVRDVVRAYDGEEDVPGAFKRRMKGVAMSKQQASKGTSSPSRSIFSFGGK
jgi:import inner membrane translocase subunit TIM50